MAVSALNNWSGRQDGDPDGASLTISAGSNRTLIMVYTAETGTHSFTSITVGGASATGQKISVSSIESNTHIWSWYWDETAIAAMSASATVDLTKTGTPTHHDWDYAVFQGVDSVTYATDTDVAASNTSISATSATSVNDWLVVAINRESANRDVTAYDNLTQEWQLNDQYTTALADGAGGDDDVALTGDGFSGSWLVQLMHLKAAGAAGPAILMKYLHEGMLNDG